MGSMNYDSTSESFEPILMHERWSLGIDQEVVQIPPEPKLHEMKAT